MTRPIGNMAHIAGFALWTEHLWFLSRGHRLMESLGFSRMIGKCESGPIYNSQYWPMNSFKDSFSSFAIRKRSSGVSRISSRLMQHSPHKIMIRVVSDMGRWTTGIPIPAASTAPSMALRILNIPPMKVPRSIKLRGIKATCCSSGLLMASPPLHGL